MSELKAALVLELIDKITQPAKQARAALRGFSDTSDETRKKMEAVSKVRASSAFSNIEKSANRTKKTLDALGQTKSDIEHFRKLKVATVVSNQAFTDSQKETTLAAKALREAGSSADITQRDMKKLTNQFDKTRNKSRQLKASHQQHQRSLDGLRKKLSAAGVNTKNLARSTADLNAKERSLIATHKKELALQDKLIKRARTLTKVRSQLGRVKTGAVGGAKVARNVVVGGAAYGAAGLGVISSFLSSAGTLEDQLATLKTLEGGNIGKAKKNLAWIQEFSQTTPYQLEQVNDAFIKLRAYGIDPIKNDTLRVLGDTAAGMGKDIIQSVEAIADAVQGENERLKEFGIKASIKGDFITYNYTKEGKQQLAKVNKNNQEMIKSTILSIWNSKYKGAMDERSKTWNGMLSNLGDQWTGFKNLVMSSGALAYLKGQLNGVLTTIKGMKNNGQLEDWAKRMSEGFIVFVKNAAKVGDALWSMGKKIFYAMDKVAGFVGGWDNLLIGIVALTALGSVAGVIVGIGSAIAIVTAGVKVLTAVLIANPIGLALAAIAVAGYLVYRNWDKIQKWWSTTSWSSKALDVISMITPLGLFKRVAQGTLSWWSTTHWGKKSIEVGTEGISLARSKVTELMSWWSSTSWSSKALDVISMITPLGLFKRVVQGTLSWWSTTHWGKKSIEVGTEAIDWALSKAKQLRDFWNGLTLKSLIPNIKMPKMPKVDFAGKWANIKAKFTGGMKDGGARAGGGRVEAGSFYKVNELGPELLNMGGQSYLMATQEGSVTPLISKMQAANQQMMPRAGGAPIPKVVAVSKPSSVASNSQSVTNHNESFTISVTVQGGSDPQGRIAAKEIERVIKQLQRKQAVRGRASMHDGEVA